MKSLKLKKLIWMPHLKNWTVLSLQTTAQLIAINNKAYLILHSVLQVNSNIEIILFSIPYFFNKA
jgi:hypothetical protein